MATVVHAGVGASSAPVCMEIEAVILRCGCGNPESHPPKIGADGQAELDAQGMPIRGVCPKAYAVNLGNVAYWHRNPLKRWAFAWKQWRKQHGI